MIGMLRGARPAEPLILILALYAAAWLLLVRLPGDILRSPIAGSDLSSYYTAGHLVRSGQAADLYRVGEGDQILGDATAGPWREAGDRLGIARQHYYIYPPFFALAVAPMASLPFPAARLAWLAMDLALLAVFAGLYVAWRRADGVPLTGPEAGLLAVALGLEFLPLIWALAIGQTSVLLLALLSGTFLLARGRRQAAAGCLLGLATAIKLTPALLIVYFALRGRMRLAVSALACFLLLNLLAVALLGPAIHAEFFGRVAPAMSGGTSYFLNQSLAGFFDRMLEGGDVRQVALASSAPARVLAAALSILLAAGTAVAIHRARAGEPAGGPPPRGLRLDLEISAVILLTLVVSPISWSHHYVLAIIPLMTVVAAAGRAGWRSPALAVAAGAAWLLIARKPHAELFLEGAGRLALSASLYGALALWVICMVLLLGRPGARVSGMGWARAA